MIFNLTQHNATAEQKEAGVVDPTPIIKKQIVDLLTFTELPTREEVVARAQMLAMLARDFGHGAVMIGGAPYLMAPLEKALSEKGILAAYAFSTRVVIERVNNDGSVAKESEFRHAGFVPSFL